MTRANVVTGRGLAKRYGSGAAAVDALRGVDLDVAAGSFTAIMGPSGSGKTTLMHILAGLDTPTEGKVEIAGTNLDGLDDAGLTRLRREKIGFIFQAFNLVPVLTAQENVALPLTLAGKDSASSVEDVLKAVSLLDRRTHRPSEMSGGQQQRVAIARALVSKPAVVFADEPTGNLDSATSHDILDLLRKAVDEQGQAIVMVTHDPLAAAVADRVVFLADGKIVADEAKLSAEDVLDRMRGLVT
ncbi:MAG: putative transport system ATP-binding protein [Actinomycetota bacterium]